MNFIRLSLAACISLSLLSGCSTSRLVRPLKADEQLLGFSAGGPLFKYSETTIPMPLSSFFYARGFTDRTSGFASLHTTSLLYGVFQTDIGVCHQLYRNDERRIGVTANPVLNLAIDRWERHLKVWPQVDMNAYWELKSKESFLYVGFSNWFELSAYKEVNDEKEFRHWIINPHLGFQYKRNQWVFIIESKFLAPHVNNTSNVVEYTGMLDRGALGIYLGVNRFLK